MTTGNENRFQDFFEEDKYVVLKNHLYNYQLRKRAIENALAREPFERILEVGSGISPVMTQTDRIVYSEISFLACKTLKRLHGKGSYVVADATQLPFSEGSFSHAVSSEVLEHVENDKGAIAELARVLKNKGRLLVTFPHRKAYYTNDDRYVKHFRRYEAEEMAQLLQQARLYPVSTRNILGPMEKLTMMAAVLCFEALLKLGGAAPSANASSMIRWISPIFKCANAIYAKLLRIEAAIIPHRCAAVLLTIAEKR